MGQCVNGMIPLGKPLTFYGLAVGLALKQIDSTHYLCSFHDGSDNRKEVVHVDDITIGGRLAEKSSTKNEVIDSSVDNCVGGGCTI